MRGFMMAENDLVISNGDIEFVEDNELTVQTIKQVMSTNQGEWLFDEDEGIDFYAILGQKGNLDESVVRNEVEQAIAQVDNTLVLDNFKVEYNNRMIKAYFSASRQDGKTVEVSTEWA